MKILIIGVLLVVAVALVIMRTNKNLQPASLDPSTFRYSQVDITESFGDNLKLTSDQWIETSPLNKMTQNPEKQGLPAISATPDEIYRVATSMSQIREQITIPSDGVYCPVCNRANVDISKLHKPCPKCGRPLLKFGWD